MRRAVRLIGRLMIVTGIVALIAIVGWQWLGNSRAQQAQAQTVHSLQRQFAKHHSSTAPARSTAGSDSATRLAGDDPGITASGALDGQRAASGQSEEPPKGHSLGEAFALIRIPRFGGDFVRPIVEGTGTAQLKEGVGHYLGTAGPGQRGNFALAGHRTTYGEPFHLIAKLRPGDRIIVRTAKHTYTYRVIGHTVVDPTDVQVIAADPPGVKPGHLLTMTSCHPMYTALQRYVVHARLVSTK